MANRKKMDVLDMVPIAIANINKERKEKEAKLAEMLGVELNADSMARLLQAMDAAYEAGKVEGIKIGEAPIGGRRW